MTVKPTAITNEEIPMYEQEENLAKLYERREDEYTRLFERLDQIKRHRSMSGDPELTLCLDICEFLLREAQYRKLV